MSQNWRVHISLPQNLNERIEAIVKQWGFSSKADFFRHTAIVYLNGMDRIQSANKGRYTNIYAPD